MTFRPFSMGRWKDLATLNHLKECLEEHKRLFNVTAVHDDLLAKVTQRV